MNTAIPILIFILILGIIVFVHEFGHFIMARRCGIFVEEFAMGMGPKILTFRGKKKTKNPIEGQEEVTLYTLRVLPLGGFCKMRGMDENVPDDPESMNNKKLFDRILVVIGGSTMNFLLALILFTILNFVGGYSTSTVAFVAENSPAQQGGLMAGDRITHINGSRVGLWDNLIFMIDTSGGNELDFRIVRENERINLTITPALRDDGFYRIGMNPEIRTGALAPWPEHERAGILGSIGTSAQMISFHIRAPFRMLARFLTGQPTPEGARVMSFVGLAGEVTEIYQTTMQQEEYAVRITVLTMIFLAGIISIGIGTMNLLPIPALDGARLVFLAIEGIRRKPISQEKEGMVHTIGFVVLLALIVFMVGRDIVNLL